MSRTTEMPATSTGADGSGSSRLSRERVREVDRLAVEELGIPSLLLMENAARGLMTVLRALRTPDSRMVVLCGHGNNGGDGIAATRLLAATGLRAECGIVSPQQPLAEDCEANRRILGNAGCVIPWWSPAEVRSMLTGLRPEDLIVDAILGTGVRGAVRAPFDTVIGAINDSAATVVAVDLPSGLDCDSGTPCGCAVRAHHTVTFVASKQGFAVPGAREFTGDVTVCDIGIPRNWLITRFPELAD